VQTRTFAVIRDALPTAGYPSEPTEPESILTYLDYLKRRVLGNYVVHHETIAARPEKLVHDLSHLPDSVPDILRIAQIPALYTHQVEGIEKVLNGQHVAVATPTASGKTMVYNVPVLSTLLENPKARALYIFPLKALEQDQFEEIKSLMDGLDADLTVGIYDGDTSSHHRKKIRSNPAARALYNPRYATLGHLGFPRGLGRFFFASALCRHRRVAHL
jgi:DEAD/DEAH box helicase domain-containing protein